MDIIEQIQQVLKARWSLLYQEWEDIENTGMNPYEKWNAFLANLGVIDEVHYEYHWGEVGIRRALDKLHDVINGDGKPVYVVDFADGSNMSSIFVFDRKKVTEALQRIELCV